MDGGWLEMMEEHAERSCRPGLRKTEWERIVPGFFFGLDCGGLLGPSGLLGPCYGCYRKSRLRDDIVRTVDCCGRQVRTAEDDEELEGKG